MKILYFGNDMFFSCLQFLMNKGHEVIGIYTSETGNLATNSQVSQSHIPIYTHKPSFDDLNKHIENGAEMFFVAEYPVLLPATSVKYAINLHSSYLPDGRGPTPLPYLFKHPEFTGITFHKLAPEFDSGDIILQTKIQQTPNESMTTLMIKMHLEAEKLTARLFKSLDKLYASATPQRDYTSWPPIKFHQRIMDWAKTTVELRKLVLQFGHFGVFVKLNNKFYKATNIEVMRYEHKRQSGHVLFENSQLLAISTNDGFACLHKDSLSRIKYESK